MLFVALVMVLASFQAPAFAQERDPNEGEPKHEINELQNWLHHTEDESKQNYIEDKIDALQEQLQEELQSGITVVPIAEDISFFRWPVVFDPYDPAFYPYECKGITYPTQLCGIPRSVGG